MKNIEEIESYVLGCCMTEPNECLGVMERLRSEHFSKKEHQLVYSAIHNLIKRGGQIDILSVTKELIANKTLEQIPGGAYYVTTLTNSVAGTSNAEHHSFIILEEYMRNQLWIIGQKMSTRSKNLGSDPFEIMDEVEKGFEQMFVGINFKNARRIDEIRNDYLKSVSGIIQSGGKQNGIPTSITSLNRHTNGWQKSDLVIVAGRPGMGKTSAALDFALTPALNGTPVAFFSLEMGEEQLLARTLSIISTYPVNELVQKRMNEFTFRKISDDAKTLDDVPLYVYDRPINFTGLRNRCKRMAKEHKIELIVIDYLQLMIEGKKNKEAEVSEISRGLKLLAKELNVPVIALSQLSREVEKRPDKKPMLSDLRDSGAIEQDADMVIFCLRPGYYDSIQEYHFGQTQITGYELNELFMFIIAKFRNGSCGEIRAKWVAENTAIKDF